MSPAAPGGLDATAMLRLAGALLGLVVGQIGLKMAMHPRPDWSRLKQAALFALAIGAMTAWFFLWMGLLGDHELSFIYPFEAVGSAILSIAAIVVLRERMTWRLAVGIALITGGVFLVSLS
ncbi:small multidrug resistance pump [Verrucomicrobium sp. GAS474]|uniref:EamA family transporter n=1 Tax=Verrucomicrobium sp. GAS474 TaxID=1882831 RepID=UPI00087C352F|nr:EamA family transporter [Verrucomicrobium sp. GAS474]SDT87996.1 small multidrug resistance pump [Verrucomicrobium sp. GAS474]